MDNIISDNKAYLQKLYTASQADLVKAFDSQGRPHVLAVINNYNCCNAVDLDANTYKQI